MCTRFAVFLPGYGKYVAPGARLVSEAPRAKQFDVRAWAEKLTLKILTGETLIKGPRCKTPDGVEVDCMTGVRYDGVIEIHTLEAGSSLAHVDVLG